MENRRKIEPKEIPSHLIPCLLVVFARQLEILVTTLLSEFIHSSGWGGDERLFEFDWEEEGWALIRDWALIQGGH